MRRLALPLRGPVVGLLALGVLVGAGCSSSSDSKGDSTTTKAPEDVLVSDAQVAAGLATLGTVVGRRGRRGGGQLARGEVDRRPGRERVEADRGPDQEERHRAPTSSSRTP